MSLLTEVTFGLLAVISYLYSVYQLVYNYMLWFSFILGLNFIFLYLKLIIIHYHTQKQREIKFKLRMKLNHNIYFHESETEMHGALVFSWTASGRKL